MAKIVYSIVDDTKIHVSNHMLKLHFNRFVGFLWIEVWVPLSSTCVFGTRNNCRYYEPSRQVRTWLLFPKLYTLDRT